MLGVWVVRWGGGGCISRVSAQVAYFDATNTSQSVYVRTKPAPAAGTPARPDTAHTKENPHMADPGNHTHPPTATRHHTTTGTTVAPRPGRAS